MSSEVHKYIEEALEKNQNLFDAEVINFPKDNLTSEEIALILGTIRSATFKGADIEILHSLTLKLQNQFINLEKK